MKYIWFLILIAGIFIYLNRSYAYFYDFQGSHFIANPYYPPKTELNSDNKSRPLRLVVLGDSLMSGTGSTAEEKSLAYLIAQKLAGEKSLTLVNLSSPGVGSKDVLERQVPQAVEEKPDYIVLMIGTNDVHNKLPEAVFADSYAQILDELSDQTKAKIIVINIPFIGSDKVLYPPWNFIIDSQIHKFNSIVQIKAAERNLKTINLYDQFNEEFRKSSDLYSGDQFHPSDKGYALWADYINENIL